MVENRTGRTYRSHTHLYRTLVQRSAMPTRRRLRNPWIHWTDTRQAKMNDKSFSFVPGHRLVDLKADLSGFKELQLTPKRGHKNGFDGSAKRLGNQP
jgi:hypothetical protein